MLEELVERSNGKMGPKASSPEPIRKGLPDLDLLIEELGRFIHFVYHVFIA
jgi:hypothetical protein